MAGGVRFRLLKVYTGDMALAFEADKKLHILLVGLNHRTAPLEVREEVSFPRAKLLDALPRLKEKVGEGVILSTCNRTEVYTIAHSAARAASEVTYFVAEYHGLAPEALSPHLYEHTDAQAARHLFRVASGLDSMVLGEHQVLGQVRAALTAASQSGSLGVPLSRLFHGAIRAGRRVREETEISRNAISISYAGVQLAQRTLGGLSGLRVLLVGAGEAGQLVARALRPLGVCDLMVANRTRSRAEELARQLSGRTVPMSEVQRALVEADIVISATDAPEAVISRDMVQEAMLQRGQRVLFLFDLAVPRDIDPRAGELEGVRLFNIDDLSAIAEENLETRRQAVAEAEGIIEEELARFMKWWESLEALPVVKALHRQAEDIRRRELARALRKLSGLAPEQQEVVNALTRSIVRKLLHDPTIALKQGSSAQLQAARELFRLEE